MMKKKAQGTEMLGLLVIIILLITLVGIYFRFASGPADTAATGALRNTQMNDMIDTMFSYTPCRDVSIKDALNTYLQGAGNVCGENSETLLKREIENILETYFGRELERGDLEFRIYRGTGSLQDIEDNILDEFSIGDSVCETGRIVARTTIHMYPQSATVTLSICR